MSKSRISLEAAEVTEVAGSVRLARWTEAMICVEREDEPEQDMKYQQLLLTAAEMAALYSRMKMYYDQGTWSTGSVER